MISEKDREVRVRVALAVGVGYGTPEEIAEATGLHPNCVTSHADCMARIGILSRIVLGLQPAPNSGYARKRTVYGIGPKSRE